MAFAHASSPSHPVGSLLAVGAALPADRVPAGRGRRCAARPDEDGITLAAQAGAEALDQADLPATLVLATTTPPYDEGGSVQVLAELLRLTPATCAVELTATARDGLSALRVALALAQAQRAPVLLCASHAGSRETEQDGDGAVALLLGPPADTALATLTMGPSHVEELRDRWRLRRDPEMREGDSSFVDEYGATRLATDLGRAACAQGDAPVAVCAPSGRAATKAERALGGAGDEIAPRTGLLGTAHPLLRLVCGLDAPQIVLAVAAGMGESVRVAPAPAAAEVSQRMRDRAAGGSERDAPLPIPSGAGFDPYASGPRAWRERGQDLRLEGIRYGDRLVYPPPAAPPPDRRDEPPVIQSLAREGTVLTHTRDHVYPGGDVTGMVVLELDDGARFYSQVAMGEELGIGDRAQLIPRRLHQGGGVVQYFWKAAPCR